MRMNDNRLDTIVGIVLRTGVTLAAALVLVGGVAFLATHRQEVPDYHKFHSEPSPLTSIPIIWRFAFTLKPVYLIQLGLLVLIATPVVRVITCVAGFALERDWMYAVVSLVVLLLLLASIVGSGL
jgi:uncharacterized membrane protein